MSLSPPVVAQAAALSSPVVGPGPRICRCLVIVAGGGRDLDWPHQHIAAELLAHSGSRPVLLVLHGGARGADQAIGRAARQLGWPAEALPADWRRYGRGAGPIRNRELLHTAVQRARALAMPGFSAGVQVIAFPGGRGTASLLAQARRMRAALPIEVIEVTERPCCPA